jgi:pimeloyl-ACP methyl ester carboxylesterase
MVMLILLTIVALSVFPAFARRIDGGGGGGGGGDSSTFEIATCPFKLGAGIIEGQQVVCGYLTVPENRNTTNSQKVKLAVAIFKSPQYMHAKDPAPVVNLEGGPGGALLDILGAAITAQNYNLVVFNHDLVLFDQRGAGYSTPSLKCLEGVVPGLADLEQRLRNCYNRLTMSGIDLDSFNTLENADDVADLIHALGYQQMTLYGASYGTRLALTVMRRHPSVVRATVLDSVDPTTAKGSDRPANALRAFSVLFQNCAADAACNLKYPDLGNVFLSLVKQLNASPVDLTYTDPVIQKQQSFSLTGNSLITWLFNALYRLDLIPQLPRLIYQLKAHDYTLFQFNYQPVVTQFSSIISWGMYYSIECSETWAFVTSQDITNSLNGMTPELAQGKSPVGLTNYDVCQFWKVKPVPIEQKQPVFSDIPTLVLSGEYDPITPPSNGQEVANNLSHSYYFLFPGQTHGEQYNSLCADQIISAFEDNPDQPPDSTCVSQITRPAFQ